MITETYVCFLDNGLLEYGYTFKKNKGNEDCEFDIPLGRSDDEEIMQQNWDDFYETAQKIAVALS